jgi:type VI secretion system secreted protein VgrG
LVDDSQGQLRMRLATKAVQAKPNVAPGWAKACCSAQQPAPAQGASVQSTQMDAAEAVAQLKAAQQLGQALSASAQQQGAQALHAFDAQQAVSSHVEAMCPTAQGKYTGLVNGQDAKKANGRTLTDPVERFAKPLVHLDTPVTAAFVTPSNISVFSGQDTGLAVQGDVQITAGHTLSSVSGQTTSLYTHAGGIKAITANGGLSLRAHTDAQQIWADQGITVQSTTDEIRIQASESITLSAGQSAIVIKGGDITFMCPGNWTVKGATHDWGSGGGGGASLMALPEELLSEPKIFDEQFHLVDVHGDPMPNTPFRILGSNGQVWVGTTDSDGLTPRIEAPEGVEFCLEVLSQDERRTVE